MRVNVYDLKNPERLLGTHPAWTAKSDTQHFFCLSNDPMYPLGTSIDYSVTPATRANPVELRRQDRFADRGWSMKAVIVTDAALEDLMSLRDFRLPGESPYGAEMRRRYHCSS